MDMTPVIDELNADMALEHRALITYLRLAFTAPDEALAAGLEGMAREEMHHLKWLGHLVVELGGQPDMKRSEMAPFEASFAGTLRSDPAGEQAMIARFQEQMALTSDHRVRRLLQRLIDDAQHQIEKLQALAAEADALPAAPAGAPAEPKTDVIEVLESNARLQYAAILQYLFQSFVLEHGRSGQQIEDIAIQEMKHLGPLAESVAEMGGEPQLEPGAVYLGTEPGHMLAKNIADERGAQVKYAQDASVVPDAAVSSMMQRFQKQEAEHESIFVDMLGALPAPPAQADAPKLTVGSLKAKP